MLKADGKIDEASHHMSSGTGRASLGGQKDACEVAAELLEASCQPPQPTRPGRDSRGAKMCVNSISEHRS